MNEKKLPIGIQTFIEIIEGGYLFVDKTKLVEELLNTGKYLFLSRPRRFGKSLLVSILENIFLGKKELFQNLFIYDKIEWRTHPVIKIDFSQIAYDKSGVAFETSLREKLDSIAKENSIQLEYSDVKSRFGELIFKLYEIKKERVVILIDEYDKPILDHLDELSRANENREVLRNFFTIIKGSDSYIHQVFITGITRFSQVSIFSGLNNILDISLDKEFASILGYSQEELELYFDDRLKEYCGQNNISRNDLLEKIRYWYNGYSWDGKNKVYNPFSILSFFRQREFRNFWFDTGTPTFIIKYIREKEIDSSTFEIIEGSEYILQNMDITGLDLTALLFQSGYLTIQSKNWNEIQQRNLYVLAFPNYEVSHSFLNYLLSNHIGKDLTSIEPIIGKLKSALHENNLSTFIDIIQSLFAGIPYNLHIPKEAYYHSLFYMILKLIGCNIHLESLSANGRVDGILEFTDKIFIIEFKFGKAKAAMQQIKDRSYSDPYLSSGKRITLLAIGFGKKKVEYLQEELGKITDRHG